MGAIYYQVFCAATDLVIDYVLYQFLFSIFLLNLPVFLVFLMLASKSNKSVCLAFSLQLNDFDMCISKNEEAVRIEPRFAECYGNMANAWKVILVILLGILTVLYPYWVLMLLPFCTIQEKGNIDLAIRYYLLAIEVC